MVQVTLVHLDCTNCCAASSCNRDIGAKAELELGGLEIGRGSHLHHDKDIGIIC
jgi:hypothetical protein